ncbi:MAG: oligosaccharide flippase family protein [Provencibacterium sp.]|nr:oligosaccharide flippase family protein [Provencibacterium sp.]
MRLNKRSVFYNVSILSLSGVFLQAVGFVYQILLSRVAGAQALGMFHLVMPVYSVMAAATITGTRLAMTSLAAGLRPERGMADIHALALRGMGAFLFLFAITALPIYVLRDLIAGRIIGEPRAVPAMVLLLACIFLSGFEGIFESLFLGIGKTHYTAISNILEQVAKILLILFLLTRFGREGDYSRTAVLLSIGMTLCEIPVLIWLLAVYRRESRRAGKARQKGKAPRVLPVATPVAFSAVVTNLLASASVVLLPQRLQRAGMTAEAALSALGVVSEMALPLITLPMVLVRSLSNVLMPVISQSSARGQRANVERKVQKSFQATGLIVLPATAILAPLCTPLARMLFGQELDSVYVLMLAAAAIVTYFEMISASILNGLGRQKATMAGMLVGESIQLFCTYFLAAIPQLHIYGYMSGMILSPFAVLLLNLWFIKDSTGFAPRWLESFVIPLLVSGTAGGFTRWFYRRFGPALPGDGFAVLAAAAVGGGVCFLLFLLTGLRPLRYYRTLLDAGQRRETDALRMNKKLV